MWALFVIAIKMLLIPEAVNAGKNKYMQADVLQSPLECNC
jgi:hypothetical protein